MVLLLTTVSVAAETRKDYPVMVKVEDFSVIKGSVMLQGFSDEDLGNLAGFCEIREMSEGTTVFIENMPGESLFLVKRGTIRISKMFAEGDEKTLVVLGPEDIFGEMAVIDGLPRSATARVAEEAELISLKKKELERLCRENASLALKLVSNIVKVFSKRVREANEEYRDMLIWSLQKT
jgi:CRP-like cAMP-binding protein